MRTAAARRFLTGAPGGPPVPRRRSHGDHRTGQPRPAGDDSPTVEDLDRRLTWLEERFRNWKALPDEDISIWRNRWDDEIEARLARPEQEVVERIEASAKEAAGSAIREAKEAAEGVVREVAAKLEERVDLAKLRGRRSRERAGVRDRLGDRGGAGRPARLRELLGGGASHRLARLAARAVRADRLGDRAARRRDEEGTTMNVSREHVIEDLNRGEELDIDLDEFASMDDGECGCAVCLAVRRALAEGHRGMARLVLDASCVAVEMSDDLLGDIYGNVPRADPNSAGLVVERSELVAHGELAQLLDALEMFERRYVVVDEAQAAAITLWMRTPGRSTPPSRPRTCSYAAEPESGKTRLLEVLQELVREPLLDHEHLRRGVVPGDRREAADALLRRGRRDLPKEGAGARTKDDLRALLNAGYRRGQRVWRMGGGNHTTLRELRGVRREGACRARQPASNAGEPLSADRAEAPRGRRAGVGLLPRGRRRGGGGLRKWLEKWTATTIDTLNAARPAQVDGLARPYERGLASAPGDRREAGEAWAARARRAALALTGADDDEASLGVLLLDDIRDVFEKRQARADRRPPT